MKTMIIVHYFGYERTVKRLSMRIMLFFFLKKKKNFFQCFLSFECTDNITQAVFR